MLIEFAVRTTEMIEDFIVSRHRQVQKAAQSMQEVHSELC